jgi:hypothetical protein
MRLSQKSRGSQGAAAGTFPQDGRRANAENRPLPLITSPVGRSRRQYLVHLIEQGSDRLGQIGAVGGLGQQASERPGTELAAVCGEATKIDPNLGDAKAKPDHERAVRGQKVTMVTRRPCRMPSA